MKRILFVAVAAVLTAAHLGAAPHFFGLGAHVSSFKASDAQEGKTFIGGQMRARLGGGLGLEASVDYREDRYVSDLQTVTLKSIPLLLSITAELLPRSPVSPYLVGGGGWYFTKIELRSEFFTIDDRQTEFGYHVGGGLLVKPVDRLGLHVDYRYTSVKFEFEELDFDAAGHMIVGGATFYF